MAKVSSKCLFIFYLTTAKSVFTFCGFAVNSDMWNESSFVIFILVHLEKKIMVQSFI